MPLRGSVASVSCSQTQMFFTGYPIFLSSFGTRNTGSPREEKEEKEEEDGGGGGGGGGALLLFTRAQISKYTQ